jgi:hypothetical protein
MATDKYNSIRVPNPGQDYKNITSSALLKTGEGELLGVVVNSHTSGTIRINDGITATTAGTKATGVLTMTGAIVPAVHTVSRLTSSGAMVAGVHGSSTLTPNAIANGNTVTIGNVTYVARTEAAFTNKPYEVLMGTGAGTDAEFLDNLKLAINAGSGAGTLYGTFTAAHPYVIATTNSDTTQVIVTRTVGNAAYTAILNALSTTGTTTRVAWTGTTIGGATAAVTTDAATVTIGSQVYKVVSALSETSGATAVPYQVLKGVAEANMLDNLKSAINGTAGVGTTFSTGTVVHPDFVATTNSNTIQEIQARRVGDATETARLNAVATTETMANTAWEGATAGVGTGNSVAGVATTASKVTIGSNVYTFVSALTETSGATAIPNQVLFGVATANALDNLKLAINAGATVGTEYSTGTITQTQVTATTNSDTEQTLEALTVGTWANSLATTTTLTSGTFAATTLTGGVDVSPLIFNTITLMATASLTSLDRFIKLPATFSTGCYATIGGTADLTFIYR